MLNRIHSCGAHQEVAAEVDFTKKTSTDTKTSDLYRDSGFVNVLGIGSVKIPV